MPRLPTRLPLALAAASCAAALLSGCGGAAPGGASVAASAAESSPPGSSTTTLAAQLPDPAAAPAASPTFHALPSLPPEPDGQDASDNAASSRRPPASFAVPPELSGIPTARLSADAIREMRRAASPSAAPLGSAGSAVTYTPAQIRSAYGLPALPASGASPTSAQAAAMGQGQTIYLVDSNDDPNAAAELAAFNSKFGLPSCASAPITSKTALPLAAPGAGCQFSVAYSGASGGFAPGAPSYDSGWATEIALDVQWAHATAPLARIVLIEAPDSSTTSLANAILLANAMGPGSVSMSWGGAEGSWTSQMDSIFEGAGMSYFAATGDNGAGVIWPSSSAKVVAVGGTTLAYSAPSARSEAAWADTGGGVSAYTPLPSYQNSSVPGMSAPPARRAAADVSFNANPYSGQYLASIAQGSTAVTWLAIGGTSLATPQWAGLMAVANAQRAAASLSRLADPHAALYAQIASVPGSYAADFYDVTSGSDGSCAACSAKAGYDEPTGLGTPNAGSLLPALAGGSAASGPPAVASASVSGIAGVALSFSISASSADPLSYSLSGAPSGMSVSSSGVVSWASPVAGAYKVVATATDAKSGLSGSGTYAVTISAPSAPSIQGASISGQAGTPLSFPVMASSADPLSYSLSGAPSGMSVSSSGVVSWASPVAGTYKVVATATDAKDGLSGSGTFTVSIAAAPPAGPSISYSGMSAASGSTLRGTISISDPKASYLSISISGIPRGMSFALGGSTSAGAQVLATWPDAAAGNYTLSVSVTDSNGLSSRISVPVSVH